MGASPDNPARERLCEHARAHPTDATAQLEAGFACDSDGLEAEAIGFYDAVWRLGVPAERRSNFLISYGSTLKNVGRVEESRQILEQAIAEGALADGARAFLALTLHAAGQSDGAIAELIGLLLEGPQLTPGLERYRRALTWYANDLRRRGSAL